MNTYCIATIVNHEEITSGIWKMELEASEIAQTARPGQFIQLYPWDERNMLARPISLSSISEKSVTIVYRVVGKGTRQLSKLQNNDRIRVMGPLGNGFALPDKTEKSIVVQDLLKKIAPSAGMIFACGPRPMLRSVSEWAKELSIPIQVSMEERMACGIGACLGCGIKIQKQGDSDWKYMRVCKDGPVFSGEEVVWNE